MMNSSQLKTVCFVSKGVRVWVPHPESVWCLAIFISQDEKSKKIIVQCTNESSTLELPLDTIIHLANEEASDRIDDLTQLSHLNEATLLHCLNERFNHDLIYTYTGSILLAMNPFKSLPSLYDLSTLKLYFSVAHFHAALNSLPPHLFGTAALAYSSLCRVQKSQTILISGESGAGKTESTKFVMKFLSVAGAKDPSKFSFVENQVLQSNPLLESLGNAKTLRNSNSSRFGKFIEMQFNMMPTIGSETLKARLCGACIQTYLLETVRVSQQMQGERNFHIFYQLCAAASYVKSQNKACYDFPQFLTDSKVQPCTFDLSKFKAVKQFRYLTKSSCFELDGVNDLECFEFTILAMQTIGISFSHQTSIFLVAGAVLCLGNLLFEPVLGDTEASRICPSCYTMLEDVASFLQLPSVQELEHALTHRSITAGKEHYLKPLTPREAEDNRDALARSLYGKLFCLVVDQVNKSIRSSASNSEVFCGVLDIFGFECFTCNSFEQLCINYTNERLQEFFNIFMFECEKKLYNREGVEWNVSDYPNNHDCVDLLERKGDGLFSLIHEECLVPRGNDRSLIHKLKERYKKHRCFSVIPVKPEWFVIHHFAGPVSYYIEGFVEKNKDSLSQYLASCVLKSDNSFIVSLLSDYRVTDSLEQKSVTRTRHMTTLSCVFREQLGDLLKRISSTDPHFIRCIKSNTLNAPDIFERPLVTEQLRYGGVLQAVQVSRAGYPIRLKHLDFLLDYRFLTEPQAEQIIITGIKTNKDSTKNLSLFLLKQLEKKISLEDAEANQKYIVIGKTHVFMKQDFFNFLNEKRLKLRKDMISLIENFWLGTLQRRYYVHLKACALIIQTRYRGYCARKEVQARRRLRSCVKLQNIIRGILVQREVSQLRQTVILFQSVVRLYHTRNEVANLHKRETSAVKIQTWWRAKKQHKLPLAKDDTTLQIRDGPNVAINAFNEGVSLKHKLCEITEALENMKREKDLLEGKLIEVYGSPAWETPSTNRLMFNDDVTCASSVNGTCPCSPEFSEAGKSPKSVEHVVQVNFLQQRERSLERVRTSAVELTAKTSTEYLFDCLEGPLETTQDYLAWIQAKYAMNHIRRNKSDVSKCDVVTAVSCNDVGVIDILILGHQSAGVREILKQDIPSFTYDQKVTFPEGSLFLHSLEKYGRSWMIGYVELVQNSHETLSIYQNCISFFLIQLIMTCQFVLLAYSPPSVLNLQTLERLVSLVHLKKLNIELCFWRTAFCSKDAAHNPSHESYPLPVFEGQLLDLLEKFQQSAPEQTNRENHLSEEKVQQCSPSIQDVPVQNFQNNISKEHREYQRVSVIHSNNTFASASAHHSAKQLLWLTEVYTESLSAVSCLLFSNFMYHTLEPYTFLAVGCIDGSLSMYRFFSNKEEKRRINATLQFSSKELTLNERNVLSPSRFIKNSFELMWRIPKTHESFITTMAFSDVDFTLFTASQDSSVRMWSIESGVCRRNFQDSWPCTAFCMMPLYPTRFLLANSKAVLRVVDSACGVVLQRIHFSLCITTLCFDKAGQLCFGGSTDGTILVFSVVHPEGQLKLLLHVSVATNMITSIHFLPKLVDVPALLVVRTHNGDLKLLEFSNSRNIYDGLKLRRVLKVVSMTASSALCYSNRDKGWIIVPSHCGLMEAYSIADSSCFSIDYHKEMVHSIAGSSSGLLFASGDAMGRITLWGWNTSPSDQAAS